MSPVSDIVVEAQVNSSSIIAILYDITDLLKLKGAASLEKNSIPAYVG